MKNPARRRERRLGWTSVAFAILVNLLLFMAMAWANASPKRRPVSPDLVVREIFHPAPPPESPPPAEEAPAAVAETDPLPSETAPLDAAPPAESFDLRLDLPALDLPAPALLLPAARFDAPAPAASAPGLLAAERADRAPRRATTPLPPYPAWARARRLEAVVTLKLVVDAAGRVQDVEIQSVEGDARFGEVARDGVRAWTYEPAVLDGKPVPVILIQRVRFQLVD